MTNRTRSKLLCSTISVAASLAAVAGFATPASAQCVVSTTTNPSDKLTCDPLTTTTNDEYGNPTTTGLERYYAFTGGVPVTVSDGVTFGYGLAVSNNGLLDVYTDGIIVDAGSPTVGGTAALDVTGTEVNLLAAGIVTNLFSGNAIEIEANDGDGGSAIDATVVNGATAADGSAVVLTQTNVAGGSVSLDVGGQLSASNGNGVTATSNGVGDIDITSTADIVEGAGGNLYNGIYANHGGTGNIIIDSSGDIGTSAARADTGILATHVFDGDVSISNGGAIYADLVGIDASAMGAGDVTVTTNGLIDSAGIGIAADTNTGLLTTNINANVTSASNALQLGTVGGDVHVNGSGNITSTGGVGLNVASNGGDQVYSLSGNVSGSTDGSVLNSGGGDITGTLGGSSSTTGRGLAFDSAGGNVDLTVDGPVSGATYGIEGMSGNGTLDLTTNGTVMGGTNAGIALTGGTGLVSLTTNGAVSSTGAEGVTVTSGGNQIIDINDDVSGNLTAVQLDAGNNISADISGNLTSTTGYGLDSTTVAGNQNLTVSGDVNSSLTGVNVTTTSGSVLADVSGDVTSTNGSGIVATTQTGGIDFTTSSDITALGAASQGVFLQAQGNTANNLSLETAAGSTIEARNVGVHVEQYGATSTGNVSVTNGADIMALTGGSLNGGILATNQGLGSVDVVNTGDIGTSATPLTGNGIWGYVYNGASSAPLSIDSSGDIYASLGIAGTNIGTGSSTITTGAGVTSGTNTGIAYNGSTGPLTITTGSGLVTGGNIGIGATSTGTQDFNVNGAVTGTGAGSVGLASTTSAARTIDIASGGSISGVASAIDLAGTGATTITNNGTLSGPYLVRNTGTGAVMLTNAAGATASGAATFSDAADTIDNSGTYTFTGATNLAGGNDIVVNRSGGTMTVNGSIDFGAGSDQLSNEAGGTLNTVTGSTISNLEVLGNAGTMNVAGTLGFTGVAPTFGNAGTLNLTGATVTGLGATTNQSGGVINTTGTSSLSSTGAFSNAGTINAGGPLALTSTGTFSNSGTIDGSVGPVTVTTPTFNNTGTIDLQDGTTGDMFTVNGAYNGGTGARLMVDSSDTVADMLTVTGAISGTTAVDANLIGTGALVAGGVQVVDGQSTSTANAFVLGNITGNAGPLATYDVTQNGSDYYLTASLTDAGFEPLSIATAAVDLWYPSADEVIANLAVPYKGEGLGVWAQGYASRDRYGDSSLTQTIAGVDYDVNQRVKVGRLGAQAGVDFGVGSMGRVGVTGGFGTHRFKGLTELDADGWNLGAYGAFGGVTGFHGELLGKYDRYRVRFRDGPLDDMSTHVKSTGIDGSIGYRMPMGSAENASLDLAAGLSHVWNKIDTFDAYGLTYDYHGNDSTRGRASARWNIGGDIQPYVQGTVYHEFANAGGLTLNDGVNNFDLDGYGRGTWGRIEAGVGGSPSRFPSFGAWVDLGDVRGLGARLGFRFGGHAEPMAPPPPAPVVEAPVEPAPATQTCYDGSVILATDTCPVPPPPPPPAAAPERG